MTSTPEVATGAKRFCRNCGKEVALQAAACLGCGLPPDAQSKFCPGCGSPTDPQQVVCVKCGRALSGAQAGGKSKIAAGLLGIFLGGLGVHKFYLGYAKEGVIMLSISVVGSIFTAGVAGLAVAVIAFVEAVIYLTKSDDEFARTYVVGRRPWF